VNRVSLINTPTEKRKERVGHSTIGNETGRNPEEGKGRGGPHYRNISLLL